MTAVFDMNILFYINIAYTDTDTITVTGKDVFTWYVQIAVKYWRTAANSV